MTENGERVYLQILAYAAVSFMFLPLISTFNELLTSIAENVGLFTVIRDVAAPFMVKMLSVILNTLGVKSVTNGSDLLLTGGFIPTRIYINWNCIGWQSFILLAFTLYTGLQGRHNTGKKLLTVFFGLEGTFLVNLIRILLPTLLVAVAGYMPAVMVHDYIGTLITLLWLALFWRHTFSTILVENSNTDRTSVFDRFWDKNKVKKERGISRNG